jgi:hypothetical protein
MTVTWSGSCYTRGYMNPLASIEQAREKEVPSITIQEAINTLRIAKLAANRRPVYVKELTRCLNQFARGSEGKPLSSITASQIETFLAAHPFCPAARKAFIGRVSTLMGIREAKKMDHREPVRRDRKADYRMASPAHFYARGIRKTSSQMPDRAPEHAGLFSFVPACWMPTDRSADTHVR